MTDVVHSLGKFVSCKSGPVSVVSQHWCKLPFEIRNVSYSFWWGKRDLSKIFRRKLTFFRKKVEELHGEKSRIYKNYFCCLWSRTEVNGLNRLKAKNHRENLYQCDYVFLLESIIFFWINDRPNFGQKLMGCSSWGPVLFFCIDCKCNDRRVNK